MRFSLIIVCLFSMVGKSFSQVMWQVKNNSYTKWYLQEHDEFTDEGLDMQKWKSGLPWGNYFYVYDLLFTSDNLEFKNGSLSLNTNKPISPAPILGENLDVEFLKSKNRFPNEKGEYTYNYSGGCITSLKKFKYGYFEMRFKSTNEKGIWPAFWLYGGSPNEEIDFYEGKGERDKQIHVDVHCPKGCEDYKGGFLNLKKNWGAWIKTTDGLSNDWNIISGEWQPDYVKFFLNGQPIGYFEGEFKTAQNLIINNGVSKDHEPFNPGPDGTTKFPNSLLVDYVRIWSLEDTIYNLKDRYKLFEYSPATITDNNLYNAQPKRKVNFVYDKNELNPEQGCITLLPVFYNKYSLSLTGKNFGKIQIDVLDRFNAKVAGFAIENAEYYIMDLSALPTGPYQIIIKVLGQELSQNVPVLNAAKMGEQK